MLTNWGVIERIVPTLRERQPLICSNPGYDFLTNEQAYAND